MADDKIDSIVDLAATGKEVSELEAQVKRVVDLIKEAKKAGADLSGSTSTKQSDRNTKKLQEAQDRLNKSINETKKLNDDLLKTQLQQAKLDAQLLKNKEAEIRLREKNEKIARQEAEAKRKADPNNVPFTINTPKAPTDFNSNRDTVNDEQESEALRASYSAGIISNTDALEQNQKVVQIARARTIEYASEIERLTGTLQENVAQNLVQKAELDEVQKKIKALTNGTDLLGMSAADVNLELVQLSETEARLKQNIADTTQTIKNQVKEVENVEGSVDQLRSKLNLAVQAYDNLTAAEQGGALGKGIQADILALNAQVTALEEGTGKFQRNVGNYKGSAKIITDALKSVKDEITKLQEKQRGLQDFSKSNPIGFKIGGADKELGEVTSQLGFLQKQAETLDGITSNPKFLNIAGQVGDTNKELKFFQQRLNELEDAGLKNSQVYLDVQKRLAELTDQLGDTREEIKRLSSDTKQFDDFAGGITFAADAMQTLAGASALFGASEGKVAEITKNLVAVQSVANGVKGLANELTTKGTFANKAFAAVQAESAVLFGKGSTAAQRFNVALKGIIILAAIAFIADLVSGMGEIEDNAEDAALQVERLNKSIADTAKFSKRALDTTKAAFDREQAQRKIKGASDKELFDAEQAYLTKTVKFREEAAQQSAAAFEAELAAQDKQIATGEALGESQIKANKDKLAILLNTSDQLKQDAIESNRELLGLQDEFNVEQANKAREAGKKKSDEAKKIAEANRNATFGIRELSLQREIDFNDDIVNNDKYSAQERLAAFSTYMLKEKQLIIERARFELGNAELTSQERLLIEAKKRDALVRLTQETSDKVREILKKDLTSSTKELAASITDGVTNALDLLPAAIKRIQQQNREMSDDAIKKAQEYKDTLKDLKGSLREEVTGLFFDAFTGGIEKQKNQIQGLIDQVEQRKAKDIEYTNQTVQDTAKRADTIAIIEANAAARKAELERKQKDLSIRRARFERAESIANIGYNTAVAITKFLAKGDFVLATIAGAIGAVQIARVLATPIPKYKMGGVTKKDGPVIMGDGGKHEPFVTPDGALHMSSNVPTLYNTPKGTKIYKDRETYFKTLYSDQQAPIVNNNISFTPVVTAVDTMSKRVEKAIARIPQPVINVQGRHHTMLKTGHSFRTYLNNKL